MKRVINKLLSILLIICMVLQCVPAAVFAVTTDDLVEDQTVYTEIVVPDADLPDNDELFAMYVEQELYDTQWTTFGTAARENLNTIEQAIYDALKAKIENVAANGGSTVFDIGEISGLKTEWTAEELGVASITGDNVQEAVKAALSAQFSLDKIMSALLSDCPFDLYWYDKALGGGVSMSYGISYIPTSAAIANMTFTFRVVSGYQDGNNTTVTDDVERVSTAKATAQAIVAEHASKTAYEKLSAYKTTICDMVEYNDEAASDLYTSGYGDPWQLIYVFDGDDTTEVVCEGYSKAFQYLCDLSGLDCISVTGNLQSSQEQGGPHMWNLVTMNGANYLVDVTSCDTGADAGFDGTFMAGTPSGSVAEGYTFSFYGGQFSLFFKYDEDTLGLWSESDLTLAATDYDPSAEPVCPHNYESVVTTPTCTEDGFTTYTCTLCSDSYIDSETAALGHTEESVPGQAANCTEAGLTDGVKCSVCGEMLTAQEEIPAQGHNYEAGACTGCGNGVILNADTAKTYSALADAVAAAAKGQTLQLQADWTEAQVMVNPGITLDLNGHQLTSDYLVCFDTAHLIDTAGTGRLNAEVEKVVLDEENAMVPVYDGKGYLLTGGGFALNQDKTYAGTGIRINALACPLRMDAVELLKDGGADNDLQVMIVLSWDNADGVGTQKFVFKDSVVAEVYTSNNGTWNSYSMMFSMTITGIETVENLSANIVLMSGTNVAYDKTDSVPIN